MNGKQTTSKIRTMRMPMAWTVLGLSVLLFAAGALFAQTPVDEDGNPLGPVYSDAEQGVSGAEAIELLGAAELEELVGPIALYPDDLLAIVLPASTYPLEIVQAARYLEELEADSSLQPDENWDDAVVALLNYPEVLRMMSDDIDWTWRLGEAVIAQQSEVVAAVEAFRDRAYAAGNLKSDERQTVTRNDEDIIVIDPVDDDVIYVPYYEPERVVVYQPRPVYHYYPRAYPVYYYPYPAGYHFDSGFFWGVTTAYRIGWSSNHLHVYHHSYHGHPYFGWNYYGNYWRRPSVYVFNTWYGDWGYRNARDRYRYGSYWRPRRHGGARPGIHPGRDRYYDGRRRARSDDGYADRDRRRDERRRYASGDSDFISARNRVAGDRDNFERRNRPQRQADDSQRRTDRSAEPRRRENSAGAIRFRPRDANAINRNGERRAVRRERDPVVPGAENRRRVPAANTGTAERRTPARTAEGRAPAVAERRNNPRPATVRNRQDRENLQRRTTPRQPAARRAPESREAVRARQPATSARRDNVSRSPQVRDNPRARSPVTLARREDAHARRAPAGAAPPRRIEQRQQRAPAPRAASQPRPTVAAPPQRRAAPRTAQRPAPSQPRARAAAPARNAAPAPRTQRAARSRDERRQRK